MLVSLIKSALGSNKPKQQGNPSHEEVTVVTTMHAAGFHKYGSSFVDSFLKFWPNNYTLILYAEGFTPEIRSDRIRVLDLHNEVPDLERFKRTHSARPSALGQFKSGYDFRFDAVRFSNKAYVLCDAAQKCNSRYMLWLDADIRTFLNIPGNLIEYLLGQSNFMAYLDRFGTHSEAGFLPFDLNASGSADFFSTLKLIYDSGQVFESREWHDSHILDCCRLILSSQGRIRARRLNIHGTMHPFVNSAPGLFMDHMKGPIRKTENRSNADDYVIPPYWRVNFHAGRYSQIPQLLRQLLPTTIVEVGTWSGWRAVQMALISLESGRPVHYTGYDVFEDYTAELDAREMNVKPHFSMIEVTRLLTLVKDVYPKFTFSLIQGDTNTTLVEEEADFVFLDGGHSVETIAHDFAAVKKSQVVLLDDYYTDGIDTSRFGCNQVLARENHFILPIADPVSGGGKTHFAITSAKNEDINRIMAMGRQ